MFLKFNSTLFFAAQIFELVQRIIVTYVLLDFSNRLLLREKFILLLVIEVFEQP